MNSTNEGHILCLRSDLVNGWRLNLSRLNANSRSQAEMSANRPCKRCVKSATIWLPIAFLLRDIAAWIYVFSYEPQQLFPGKLKPAQVR